ncbi:MAG: metallophosphoesterase family protein [Thaumarchaeota archaeon]|nr:metallophosphoesterase family protein [Nitrososphaerota archaeon]
MESFAVISDVHSNLEALGAVMKEVAGLSLVCLGDVVGYGASPNEVIDVLRDGRVTAILGNHDYAASTGDVAMFNARAAMAALWTGRQLTGTNLAFLRGLPRELKLEREGIQVHLFHGSPDDPLWEYVTPSTHSQLFGHYLERRGAKLIALGHTHIPYVWSEEAGTVFNPGSVGQPRDGDRRASFSVVTIGPGGVKVHNQRVDYDVAVAAGKIRKAGLPESIAARLEKGV